MTSEQLGRHNTSESGWRQDRFASFGVKGHVPAGPCYLVEIPPGPLVAPAAKPQEGQSQRAALTEQLGLRLKSNRGEVRMLVIDAVDVRAPNRTESVARF